MGENEKNEQNSQIRSVFWLVNKEIHKTREYQSIWGPQRDFLPQEGVKST